MSVSPFASGRSSLDLSSDLECWDSPAAGATAPEAFEAWAARRLATVAPGPPVGATIGWWRRHTPHDEHAWLLALAVELRDEVARQLVVVYLIGMLEAIRVATPTHEISRRLRRLADEIDFPDPREVTLWPTTTTSSAGARTRCGAPAATT